MEKRFFSKFVTSADDMSYVVAYVRASEKFDFRQDGATVMEKSKKHLVVAVTSNKNKMASKKDSLPGTY